MRKLFFLTVASLADIFISCKKDDQKAAPPQILPASIEWQKGLGGTRADIAQCIEPTPDGGYILAGNTNSPDGDITGYHSGPFGCYQSCFSQPVCDYFPDGLLMKISSTGTIEWQKAIGGSAADNLLSIQPTADGGYIASSLTYSNDGDVSGYHGGNEADAWVVKLDGSGGIEWQKALGGSSEDIARSVQPTADGGFVVAGSSKSNNGDVNGNHGNAGAWVVKLSSVGAIQWQKALGGTDSDFVNSIERTTDESFIIAGQAGSNNGDLTGNHGNIDAWIIKLKP